MRINIYTEELLPFKASADGTIPNDPPSVEIAEAKYISSRTGESMTNYGLRIYLRSAPELHYIPSRDDDRSAITFWCGTSENNVLRFLEALLGFANPETLRIWREKTQVRQNKAEDNLS